MGCLSMASEQQRRRKVPRNLRPRKKKSPPLPLPFGCCDIVIGDLGMAQQLSRSDGALKKEVSGSAGFLAPESWSNTVQTFKSDIWATGVVLFEMIYGVLPYQVSSAI